MRTFSADEIFRIAEEIERKGQAYYAKAADIFPNSDQRKMFTDLAAMENNHLNDFTLMREQFKDDSSAAIVDVDNESGKYLKAIANGIVFDPDEDPTDFIKKDSDLIEILKKAIDLEKNSIIFYIGIKDSVVGKSAKNKVEAIIQQELGHINLLSEKISALR